MDRDLSRPHIVQIRDILAALLAAGTDALKVSIAGGEAVINVDMAQVDVNALITGIANGKTLADLNASLTGVANGKTIADLNTALSDLKDKLDILAGAGLVFARTVFAGVAGGDIVTAAAAAGKVARVHGLALVVSEAASLGLLDSDDNVLYPLGDFVASGGIVLDHVAMAKLAYAQAPNEKGLKLGVSAGTVKGYVLYSLETLEV